jgi:hypothetical protein
MNGTPRAGCPVKQGSSPQHRPSSWTPQVSIITRNLPPNIISRKKGLLFLAAINNILPGIMPLLARQPLLFKIK